MTFLACALHSHSPAKTSMKKQIHGPHPTNTELESLGVGLSAMSCFQCLGFAFLMMGSEAQPWLRVPTNSLIPNCTAANNTWL